VADTSLAACKKCSVPIKLAAKLLQRQFSKDEPLAWKFELVRRRDQLARLEAEAQVRKPDAVPQTGELMCWVDCAGVRCMLCQAQGVAAGIVLSADGA
jgi:hypothetical protein